MKTKKETGALNEKVEELSDDMLDSVSGGANELPLRPVQTVDNDIVLNTPQSGSGNIVLNSQQNGGGEGLDMPKTTNPVIASIKL